jgi:hypothetical protein
MVMQIRSLNFDSMTSYEYSVGLCAGGSVIETILQSKNLSDEYRGEVKKAKIDQSLYWSSPRIAFDSASHVDPTTEIIKILDVYYSLLGCAVFNSESDISILVFQNKNSEGFIRGFFMSKEFLSKLAQYHVSIDWDIE